MSASEGEVGSMKSEEYTSIFPIETGEESAWEGRRAEEMMLC